MVASRQPFKAAGDCPVSSAQVKGEKPWADEWRLLRRSWRWTAVVAAGWRGGRPATVFGRGCTVTATRSFLERLHTDACKLFDLLKQFNHLIHDGNLPVCLWPV